MLTLFETLSVAISTLSALLTVAGIVLILLQVRQAAAAQAADHLRQRRQATVDFYSETMEHRLDYQDLLPNDRDDSAVAAFLPDPADLTHERNKIITGYLNYFELFATGVNLEIYDLDTIDYLAGPRLIKTFDNYTPWIEGRRQFFNEMTLYCEWQLLAETLRDRRSSAPVRS